MFQDLGEGLQREHVQVEKIGGLLVDGFLKPFLCG